MITQSNNTQEADPASKPKSNNPAPEAASRPSASSDPLEQFRPVGEDLPGENLDLGEEAKSEPFETFDIEELRLDPSYLQDPMAKQVITEIPVRRPPKQAFFRVHPTYHMTAGVLELEEDRETYILTPRVIAAMATKEHSVVTLRFYVTRQGAYGIWPLKLPNPEGRKIEWHTSALSAAACSVHEWIRLTPNQSLGKYVIVQATEKLSEPEWPELSFQQIVDIGFRGKVINSLDHIVLKKLSGRA